MSYIDYSKHLIENQKKITEVSLRDLYIACYKGNIQGEKGILHWHDFFECIYVNEGELSIAVGLHHFDIHKGEMILINSDVIHELMNVTNSKCIITSCVFHPFYIANEKESVIYHKYVKPIITNPSFQYYLIEHDSPNIQQFIKASEEYDNEKYGYELKLRNLFSSLIVEISSNLPMNSEIKQSNFNVKEARLRLMSDYIHKYYYEQITLKDIANSAMVSESECLRCFKTIIQISPIKYLVDYRLRVASHLLIESNSKIDSICLDVGFLDFSYFTKAFKNKYGISPKEYRKQFSSQ